MQKKDMPTTVKIVMEDVTLDAEFFDTECAKAIVAAVPIDGQPNEWGDEFYFTIPVQHALDHTATTSVVVGDIGYWPPGSALAIFFGPTPMSTGTEPVPASAVNVVGKITGNPALLRNARGARTIRIEPRT